MLNTISGLLGGGAPPSITDYVSIATTTVGSGGTSTVTFSSIPSTYTHLQIRLLTRTSSSGFQVSLNFNSDTASNYSDHFVRGNGSAASSYGAANGSNVPTGALAGTGDAANIFGASVIDILDYKDTNKYKTVRCLTGYDANGSGIIGLYSASWRNTAAISSITATIPSNTFLEFSQLALYGIK